MGQESQFIPTSQPPQEVIDLNDVSHYTEPYHEHHGGRAFVDLEFSGNNPDEVTIGVAYAPATDTTYVYVNYDWIMPVARYQNLLRSMRQTYKWTEFVVDINSQFVGLSSTLINTWLSVYKGVKILQSFKDFTDQLRLFSERVAYCASAERLILKMPFADINSKIVLSKDHDPILDVKSMSRVDVDLLNVPTNERVLRSKTAVLSVMRDMIDSLSVSDWQKGQDGELRTWMQLLNRQPPEIKKRMSLALLNFKGVTSLCRQPEDLTLKTALKYLNIVTALPKPPVDIKLVDDVVDIVEL
jgi:hypothetical protein